MKKFNKLLKILKKLRDPNHGCPWDLEQTESNLKEYIIEESYELIEAIENGSTENKIEELGDLLLQIVFICQINKEKNNFTIKDVLNGINNKLIKRHPHVFGNIKAKSSNEVRSIWEKAKRKEKKRRSVLSDYPSQMPSLSVSKRISEQASSVGFDWNSATKAIDKVEEEIKELREELLKGKDNNAEEEIGDILFAVSNVSRLLKINPEFALKKTNTKFKKRFGFIEEQLRKEGKKIDQVSLKKMEELWEKAKTLS